MAADIWTFPPTAESIRFLIGYDVVATDGKIGSIDEHSLASDSSYIVLNTGWWLFERKRLIPCGFISSIDGAAGKIFLSRSRCARFLLRRHSCRSNTRASQVDTTLSTGLRELSRLPAKPPLSANTETHDRPRSFDPPVIPTPVARGSLDDLLWHDPAHQLSGLLHVISANLGGDLVVWATVDTATGLVTLVDLADPIAPAHLLADLMQRSGAVSPNSLSARVALFGQSLFVPQLDIADYPSDAFPDPWPGYLATNPIHGLIAVPIVLDDTQTGVLIAARRDPANAYTADDLLYVESGAQRLVGRPMNAAAADDTDAVGRVVVRWISRQRRRLRPRELLLGACLPLFIISVPWTFDDPANYRPGVLLLLACIVAAVIAGARAAALAGLVGALALWWAFTPVEKSWAIATQGDLVGLVLFVAGVCGVIILDYRLEELRESERLEHQLSETLLDQSPVAIAVFDHQLRYQRVNRPMAAMNGSPAPSTSV